MNLAELDKFPDCHREIIEVAYAALVELGVEPARAEEMALAIKERFRRDVGGRSLHVNKGKYEAAYVQEEISRRLNRHTLPDLCREFDLSATRVYEIARKGNKPS